MIAMQNKDGCNLERVLPALPGAVLYLPSTYWSNDLSVPGQNSNSKQFWMWKMFMATAVYICTPECVHSKHGSTSLAGPGCDTTGLHGQFLPAPYGVGVK